MHFGENRSFLLLPCQKLKNQKKFDQKVVKFFFSQILIIFFFFFKCRIKFWKWPTMSIFDFFFGFSLKLKSLKKNFFSLFYTIFKMLGKPRKFFFAIKILVRVSVNQKKVELEKKIINYIFFTKWSYWFYRSIWSLRKCVFKHGF